MNNQGNDLGQLIKRRRKSMGLTLAMVSKSSGVSPSHLGRIENGKRFPSAMILRKITKPLGFEEDELMTLAGYLSPKPAARTEKEEIPAGRLDPYVARVLAEEPVEVQRTVIGILVILKSIAEAKGTM